MEFHSAYGLNLSDLDVIVVQPADRANIFAPLLHNIGVENVRIIEAPNAALKAMKAEPANLLITYWDTGNADPSLIIRWMRQKSMAPLCFVPVIVASPNASKIYVMEAARAGASQFIVLPTTENILRQRLEWLLDDDRRFVPRGGFYVLEKAAPSLAGQQQDQPLRRARRQARILAHPPDMEVAGAKEILPPATEIWEV